MQKVASTRRAHVARAEVAPMHKKAQAMRAAAPQARRDEFAPGKASSIARELAGLSNAPQLKTGAQRLPAESWNKQGNEPSPTYFTDIGKPSGFWKAALKDPKLAHYAHRTSERTMLTVGGIVRDARGLKVDVSVYANGPKGSVRVHVPADAGLDQLVKDPKTNRAPVLPLPLGIYTKEGSALAMNASGEELGGVAGALGTRMTQPLWNPSTETYDRIGTAQLANLSILDVDVSIYGDVNVTYRPEYDMGQLRLDPLSYKMMSPGEEQRHTVTFSPKGFLELPPFFAPLKAQVAKALGD